MAFPAFRKRLLVAALACSLSSVMAHADSTIAYTYTDLGQIASVDGPRSDVSDITHYTYDASGNLTTVTNALGQVTTLSNFDNWGNPQTVTDPNGIVTTLTYTPQGWLASSSVAGSTTQFAYNAVGDLTQITAPDGSFLTYTYDDARRLIAVTNTLGETQTFTLDAMGNRTSAQLKDASGTLVRQQQRTYDELGRLLTQIGASGQTVHYAYNLNDQRTQQTDALSHTTNQAFDALGRVTQVTDPLGGLTALTYNTNDQLTQVVDPRGVTTQYSYDSFGHLTSVASPDGGTSSYVYDDAGNVIQKTDPRGIVTTYQYDALNRLVAQSYPANSTLNVVYTYDQTANGNLGIGHLTSLQDASGTTTFTYDNRGQRIAQNKTLNLAGLALSSAETFSYDSAGRLTQHGYPDSVAVNYTRNNAGQVTAVSLNLNGQTLPIASNIAYAAFGPVTQLTWGNSLTLNRTYDQDYQLTAQTIGSWQFQYAFDAAGNLSNQQNNLWGSVQYQYDALDRLTREQSSATQKDYTLDATGNRTQRTTTDLASGTVTETQPATVASDSNRLATLDSLTLPYDAAGNLQQHTTGLRYTYDESGRMNAVYQAGAQRVAVYSYNALGQRSLKLTYDPASGALQTGSTFYYGPTGELIGQTDYSGTTGQRQMTRYWVWLDNLPLAQVELTYTQGALSGGQIIYLHPDHLNAPRIATSQQAIVWTWNSDAFGAALPNEDVDGNGVATHIPLRFPGQYYDAQTQLSYNYFRDYDANLGRYVQSDPIGLNGGSNTYGYVYGSPLNSVDFYGLKVVFDETAPGIDALKSAYAKLKTTMHGASMCKQLENFQDTYTITTKNAPDTAWYEGSTHTIRIDPGFSPVVQTTAGPEIADLTTILGHEVGHAATKIWDVGIGDMDNVNANENPVRIELGLPTRIAYP